MYRTTGLYRDEIVELCAVIHRATAETGATWPPKFGLYKSVLVTLIYFRHNRIQEELAETYATSQPTVSRAISALTPLLAVHLRGHVPTAEELDPHASTSPMEPCCHAGPGRRAPSCTPVSTRPLG